MKITIKHSIESILIQIRSKTLRTERNLLTNHHLKQIKTREDRTEEERHDFLDESASPGQESASKPRRNPKNKFRTV